MPLRARAFAGTSTKCKIEMKASISGGSPTAETEHEDGGGQRQEPRSGILPGRSKNPGSLAD